jgi:cobalt-precorrin 5A hydrolase
MDPRQGVSAPATIAVGIGCRRGVAGHVIRSLVESTLSELTGAEGADAMLFTIEDKRDEAGIGEAAAALCLALVFLPREALREASSRVVTRSTRSEARFGVGSVAEAAALAGAGHGSYLVVPRRSNGQATCAIAAPAVRPLFE